MTTQQDTHRPLPPPAPEHVPSKSGSASVIVMFLGLIAWGGAWATWAGAEDADVPTANYFLAVCLTIVGATFLLLAAIYDATRRDR